MMSPERPLAAALALTLALPCLLLAHGEAIEVGGGGGPVTLNDEQQAAIGLATAEADFRDIDRVLEIQGTVKLVPDLHSHVTSRIPGRVLALYAAVGDRVVKGQKLAEIQSLQLGNPPPVATVEATTSGVVNDRGVTLGQSIDPGLDLFHVVDLSRVIVQGNVYEEDVGKVVAGQACRVRVLGYPDETFPGKTTYVGLELDPETRTLPLWISVQNPGWKLRPEMFAQATVVLGRSEGVLVVPQDAVLEERGERFVFVRNGNTFDRVDIQTGVADDRFVEVTDGLVPGDVVVTTGKREVYTSWLTGGSGKSEHGDDH